MDWALLLSGRPVGCFGSKAAPGLCQAIVSLMPPHSLYSESRPGGGALMKRRPPAARPTGIDRDARAPEAFACGYPVESARGCAHGFPAAFPFRGPEPVYGDPPHPHAARRSRRRCRFDCAEAGHIALPDLLTALPCRVTVPGHPPALCDGRLAGWRRLAPQVTAQGIARTEAVRFSFAPDRVRRAGCAGRSFADRRRIRRKAASRGRRCAAMPAGERLAVTAAMTAVEADGNP